MLSVSLLGRSNIRYDDIPVTDIDTLRLQSLSAYLILNRDSPQSRAHLAFLFWSDTTEAKARTNLRNLLHNLRHALPDADSYLEASVQTLKWRSETSFSLDVVDFKSALAKMEQEPKKVDSAAISRSLEHAVTLYAGDLLPSCYDDWIIPQREELRQAYLSAVERLVHLLEEQDDYQAAIDYAQQLLRSDPFQEATFRNLIHLYALNGDRAGALITVSTTRQLEGTSPEKQRERILTLVSEQGFHIAEEYI